MAYPPPPSLPQHFITLISRRHFRHGPHITLIVQGQRVDKRPLSIYHKHAAPPHTNPPVLKTLHRPRYEATKSLIPKASNSGEVAPKSQKTRMGVLNPLWIYCIPTTLFHQVILPVQKQPWYITHGGSMFQHNLRTTPLMRNKTVDLANNL